MLRRLSTLYSIPHSLTFPMRPTEIYAVGDTEDISSTDFLLRTPWFCLSLITGSSVSNELLMSCQLLMQIEEETDIEEMTDIQLECGLSDLSTLLKM